MKSTNDITAALSEHVGKAAMRLFHVMISVPPVEDTKQRRVHRADKDTIVTALEKVETRPPSAEVLRQRIAELNRGSSLLASVGSPQTFSIRSEANGIILTLDFTLSDESERNATRERMIASTKEDTSIPSESLEMPRVEDGIRAYQVFVSHAWEDDETEAVVSEFVNRLRKKLENLGPIRAKKYKIKVWFDRDNLHGRSETFDSQTIPACRLSSAAIFLLSDKWYTSKACQVEADCFKVGGKFDHRKIVKIQTVGLRSNGSSEVVSGPVYPELWQPTFATLAQLWSKGDHADRDAFLTRIQNEVCSIFDTTPSDDTPQTAELDVREALRKQAAFSEAHDQLVREGKTEAARATRAEGQGEPIELLPLLSDWALGPGPQSRVFALLGSFGAGKTTAVQLFASRLTELRASNSTTPYPVYLDFRRLVGAYDVRDGRKLSLPEIIAQSLNPNLSANIDGAKVLEILRNDPCVIIFDGLDEVGTRIGPERTTELYRQLLEIVPTTTWIQDEKKGGAYWDDCGIRLIITCRTHFFRTHVQERSVLNDHGRQGLTSGIKGTGRVVTYYMAPFTPEQIRNFFLKTLGTQQGLAIFKAISSTTNIVELAQKPVMTRFIAEITPELLIDYNAGRSLNAAAVYGHLFNKALERDSDKRPILDVPDRMHLLESLAQHFWQRQTPSIAIDELELWFDQYLMSKPILAEMTKGTHNVRSLLKTELRNASLLVRQNDDEFGFVHTSFFEYFLALSLKKSIINNSIFHIEVGQRINQETCMFLIDSTEYDKSWGEFQSGINNLLVSTALPTYRQLAIDIMEYAKKRGIQWLIPSGANFSDLNLQSTQFGSPKVRTMIHGASFESANLSNVSFEGVQFIRCEFTDANLSGANFGDCSLSQCFGAAKSTMSARLLLTKRDEGSKDVFSAGLVFDIPSEPSHNDDVKTRVFSWNTESITDYCLSPDNKYLAHCGYDSSVYIFDISTGVPIIKLNCHNKYINSIVFSNCGRWLLTGSEGAAVNIYDVTNGSSRRLTFGNFDITCAKFAADDTQLVIGGSNGCALVAGVDGRVILQVNIDNSEIWDAVLSPNNKLLACATSDKKCIITNAINGVELFTFSCKSDSNITNVEFSPDSNTLLIQENNNTRILDLITEKEVVGFENFLTDTIRSRFSTDGQHILVAAASYSYSVDISTGTKQPLYQEHQICGAAKFSLSGNCIAYQHSSGFIVRNITTGSQYVLNENSTYAPVVSISPDNKWISSTLSGGSVFLIDTLSGHIKNIHISNHLYYSAFFSPDSTKVAYILHGSQVCLHDISTGTSTTKSFSGLLQRDGVVGFEGELLKIISYADGMLRKIDFNSSNIDIEIPLHMDESVSPVRVLQYKGAFVSTCPGKGTIAIIDILDGTAVYSSRNKDTDILRSTISNDGLMLMNWWDDHTVTVSSIIDRREICCISVENYNISDIEISPNGSVIATLMTSGDIIIYDSQTGIQTNHIGGVPGVCEWFTFSGCGNFVVASSDKGTFVVYSLSRMEALIEFTQWLDAWTISDGEGAVLSMSPNAWKYVYGLREMENRLPEVVPPILCDAMPIELLPTKKHSSVH